MQEMIWDSSHLQDQTLIRRSQNGDQRAFEDLIQKYQHQLLSLVCWHAGPAADTDDILQLILCKVYFSLQSFDINRPFYPWLRRIAVNRCCDEKRRLRRRRVLTFAELKLEENRIENELPALGTLANPYYSDRQQDLHDALRTIIEQLPEEHRDIIRLRHLQQASYEEIGDILGCTPRAARVKACRARAALKRLIVKSSQSSSTLSSVPNFFRTFHSCCRKTSEKKLFPIKIPRLPGQSNSRRYVMHAE